MLLVATALVACDAPGTPGDPEDERYREAVSAFHVALSAIETDQASFAFFKMSDVADLYPEEPAVWANLGVFSMRQGNLSLADEQLTQARELAPEHPEILFLTALLENRRGNPEAAIPYLRRSLDANPDAPRVRFALVRELERQDDLGNAAEIEEHLEILLEGDPGNLLLRIEAIRLAAKTEDGDALDGHLSALEEDSSFWPEPAREQLAVVRSSAGAGSFTDVILEIAFLQNALAPLPEFRRASARIELPADQIAFTLPYFIELPNPELQAAEPDLQLAFDREEIDRPTAGEARLVRSVTLSETAPPLALGVAPGAVVIDSDEGTTELAFPGEPSDRDAMHAVAQLDFDYDFLMDLAFAGTEGFRLHRQTADFTFSDITDALGLPSEVVNRPYRAVWAVDIDVDGDLDLVLSPVEGEPVVLRNNGDRTFTPVPLFSGVESPVDFLWVDLDADGVPDALFLEEDGTLHHSANLRGGEMVWADPLPISTDVAAMGAADLRGEARFDLLVLTADGTVSRIFTRPDRSGWQTETVLDDALPELEGAPGAASLFVEDLDNNGSLDLVVSTPEGTRVWLSDDSGTFHPVGGTLPGRVTAIVDAVGDGRLDMLGVDPDRRAFRLLNQGTLDYGFRSIRVRASGPLGDQRINSFGIGGELEVRTGLLYQKQPIRSPIVHFGLGHFPDADMLRIIWPNGSVQAEFSELGMGETLFGEQILKGSCPWLFTFDGEEHRFITDLIWRSPLGLRINAQETAGVMQTEDRVRIPGDALVPVDGVYDLRITAELWETHFFDRVRVQAIDHPEGTEVFIDERFAFPPPELDLRVTGETNPVARVLDEGGNDLTDLIREIDGRYLHTFERTPWQGLTHEHTLEIVLGDEPPAEGPLWLVAHGWIRPTDSSINLALSQGAVDAPTGIQVDVPDGRGGWITVEEDWGFPAGKTKTVLLDLEGIFPDPDDRRLRFTSTSELFWDAIHWAEGLPEVVVVEHELDPVRMDLAFRGYSEWIKEDHFSPELPDYNIISGTTPRWLDLEGFYTRYGDVSELLEAVDDRYVIMNAGDELQLEFAALDDPPEGYRRTFVMIADGWVKDGDFNTEFSKTVLPLPSRDFPEYDRRPGRLEDDPVYQRHSDDWVHYHTRYVTPDRFVDALTFGREREDR